MTGPWVEGGCHCGRVRFRVRVAPDAEAVRCSCSVCAMKGILHLIVPASDFELLRGAEALSEYRFNSGVARHLFCAHCGMHPFYHPRSHPDGFDVNLNCLDDLAVRDALPVRAFDGRAWEDNVSQLPGATGR